MADAAAMAVGVVVGAIASSYTKTMRTAEDRAQALGDQWRTTNKRLKNAGDVVRYRGELERLRAKQAGAAVSSERLNRGVRDLERRYREAKRELKSYGVQVGDAAREQRRLQREMRATSTCTTCSRRCPRSSASSPPSICAGPPPPPESGAR